MRPGSSTDPEVSEVTVLLAGLEITITARPQRREGVQFASRASSTVTAPVVSGTWRAPTILGSDPVDQHLISLALLANGPTDYSALPLDFLDHLLGRLRSSHREWTGKARVGRAFKAGVAARLRLSGELTDARVEGIPFRNSYYICLQSEAYPEGFWTCNYGIYIRSVSTGSGDFEPISISHSFATRAESEAYLVGSGRPWPIHLQ